MVNLCQDGHDSCRLSRGCTLYGVWKRGQEKMLEVYRGATLDQLAMAELKPDELAVVLERCGRRRRRLGHRHDPRPDAGAGARPPGRTRIRPGAHRRPVREGVRRLGSARGRAAPAPSGRPRRSSRDGSSSASSPPSGCGCSWSSARRWACAITASCSSACRWRSAGGSDRGGTCPARCGDESPGTPVGKMVVVVSRTRLWEAGSERSSPWTRARAAPRACQTAPPRAFQKTVPPRSELRAAQGVFVASLKTFPSFITKPTFSSTRTSFSGSPVTATMSA